MFELAVPTTKKDARRTLAAAMIAIGRAEEPLAEFQNLQGHIESAMAILGRDFSAQRFLSACGFAADSVTPADERPALPEEAVQELRALLRSDFGVAEPALVAIEEVTGGGREGYDLTFTVGKERRHAFAIEYDGTWVFAPGPIGREDLDAVTSASRRHFDLFVATGLRLRGLTPEAIAELRAMIQPVRALWPDEADPYGACDKLPLVFLLRNPLPNDRAFFCGYDPMSEKTEPYDTDEWA